MVRKIFQYAATILGLIAFWSSIALAQNTTVSATIKDALGNPLALGTWKFVYLPPPGGPNIGTGASTTTQSGTLDASGAFSGVSLGDLKVLGGGFWQATICTVGNVCATTNLSSTYVYGPTASLSTVLSTAAPATTGTSSGFTFGAATGGSDMYTLQDSASNTGTGNVLKLATASGSAAMGLTVGCAAQATAALPASSPTCVTLTGGAGGVSSNAVNPGGNGGVLSATTGAGGAGASTGTAGNGGEFDLITGVGGAASGVGAVGGNAGLLKLLAGNGGGSVTGGVGGALTITAGNGGAGSTANGNGGAVTIQTGTAGTGAGSAGSPGAFTLKQAATTVLGVAGSTGSITLQSAGTNPTNEFLFTGTAQTGSPAVSQFSVIDTTANTNTGPVFDAHSVGTSTALPMRVTAGGTANGVQMTTAGLLQKIGTGSVKADASTAPTDGFYFVPPTACSMALTTGTYAANPANSGGLSAPALVKAATNNFVLQLTTTAAANTTEVQCDLSPPSRSTSGKGLTVTEVDVYYGYQTTALTSIGGAGFATLTYGAAGGAAAGTVASAGGVLTVTAGTSHVAPGAVTITGQCYHESVSFGTPLALNTATAQLTYDQTFSQSAASAEVIQFCGAVVFFNNQVL